MHMKKIYFLIDGLTPSNLDFLNGCKICHTFKMTEEELKHDTQLIATYSMIHLSFDLLDRGYRIYLVHDGNILEVAPGMPEIDKELRRGHNIRNLFLAGIFDELIKLKR